MTPAARRLELAFWLTLAAAGLALTVPFADEPGSYRWGAASWPRAVLILMVVVALIQFSGRRGAAAARRSGGGGGRRLAATLALPLVYLALLPYSGFYATTPVFLFALLLLLGERRWRYLIGAPLVIFAVVCVLFTTLFYVALPTGVWPGFYDFSNALIVLLRGGR